MDLLEIRKKAKEKEGKDTAQPLPEAVAGAPAENQPEVPVEAASKKEKRQRRKSKSGKKAGGSAAKPEGPDQFLPEELAEGVEALSEETSDVLSAEVPLPPAPPEMPVDTPAYADLTVEEPVEDDPVVEYLAFMLASEEYAVKVEDVKEIIRGQSITAVPRTPEFVIGIISLRGVILPVFDIKKRLGLEGGGSRKTARIIVVADNYGLQGIKVDKVTGVVKLRKSAVEPPPAVIGGVEAEYLNGIGRIGDRLLILFNTDKVLTVG